MNRFFKDSINLIKNYKWNSMFFRYFKVMVFLIIIPALLFIFLTLNYYVKSTESEITSNHNYQTVKASNTLENAYDAIESTYKEIYASPLNPHDDLKGYSTMLSTKKKALPFVNSISLYLPHTDYVVSSYGSSDLDTFRDISWLNSYNSGKINFSIHSQPRDWSSPIFYNICKEIFISNNERGLLIFTIDGELLSNHINQDLSNSDSEISLYNGNNQLLFSSKEGLFTNNSKFLEKIKNTTYRSTSSFKDENYFHTILASENHDFKMISSISTIAYDSNYKNVAKIMITYFLITFLLVIIFSLIVALIFYRSVVRVVLKATGDDNLNIRDDNNELMYLSNTLLNTIKNHKEIESQLIEKISKLKKAQSIALQTQINPHFLFNSLNLVNGFILEETKGDSRASTTISNLSDILYIALNTKEYIVSVETELYYAKKYIEIEQIKYPDKFTVNFNIDPETLDLKTVKFVLQPIIENAIEHGIKKLKENTGLIEISSMVMNNRLILSVSDNGPKIPDDTLKILESRLESDEIQETKHIGLSNVNQRIKLIFGDEFGVSVFSDENSTVIDIIMPIK